MSKSKNENTSLIFEKKWKALEYLYYVVVHAGVVKGAKAMGIKYETVRKALTTNLCPNEMLTDLYSNHRTAEFQLTTLGEMYHRYACELMDMRSRISDEMETFNHFKNNRTFRIAAAPLYNSFILPELVAQIGQTSPGSIVKVINVEEAEHFDRIACNDGFISAMLSENKIDLYLGSSTSFARADAAIPIGNEEWKLLYHREDAGNLYEDPLTGAVNSQPIEITARNLLRNNRFIFCDYWRIKPYIGAGTDECVVGSEMPNYEMLNQCLRMGEQMSIVPESMAVNAHTEAPNELMYTDIPEEWNIPPYEACAYRSSANVYSSAGKYLEELIRNISEDYYG